ncbi:MAG: hypothetical protein R3C44_19035 [Chloroflexota bacterium]
MLTAVADSMARRETSGKFDSLSCLYTNILRYACAKQRYTADPAPPGNLALCGNRPRRETVRL